MTLALSIVGAVLGAGLILLSWHGRLTDHRMRPSERAGAALLFLAWLGLFALVLWEACR